MTLRHEISSVKANGKAFPSVSAYCIPYLRFSIKARFRPYSTVLGALLRVAICSEYKVLYIKPAGVAEYIRKSAPLRSFRACLRRDRYICTYILEGDIGILQ